LKWSNRSGPKGWPGRRRRICEKRPSWLASQKSNSEFVKLIKICRKYLQVHGGRTDCQTSYNCHNPLFYFYGKLNFAIRLWGFWSFPWLLATHASRSTSCRQFILLIEVITKTNLTFRIPFQKISSRINVTDFSRLSISLYLQSDT